MSKRPCAIALTPDDSTILCGDKFGDVYALPLLGEMAPQKRQDLSNPPPEERATPKPFTPTASVKTVHTRKNLQALKNQQRIASMKKEKETPGFEHHMLLGHVSLLTDLLSTSLDAITSPSSRRRRNYILTADRDEHIRISRGQPQAHIIEGYCLGHKNFISNICIPEAHQRLLISGGGDDHLHLWNWVSQELLQRFNLKEIVQNILISASWGCEPDRIENIAVSGILALHMVTPETQVFVTCEA